VKKSIVDWRKAILVASQFFVFSHSLGHQRPRSLRARGAGLWARTPEVSRQGFDRLAKSLKSGGFISRMHSYEDCVDQSLLAAAGEVIEQLFGAFISWHTCTLPVLCCTEASRKIEGMGL
jgi:hypothetical protein